MEEGTVDVQELPQCQVRAPRSSLSLLLQLLLRLDPIILQYDMKYSSITLRHRKNKIFFLPPLITLSIETSKPDPDRPSFPPTLGDGDRTEG